VPLELKHHHGGISVPDLEASIRWYADVLGFQVEQRMEIGAIPAKIAMLRRGDLRVELFEVPGARPLSPERREPNRDLHTHGNKHLAFAIRDVDEAERALRALGADIVFVGRFEFGANIFLRDNAGNLVELVEQPDMWSQGATE
jgi:methylmalonyl-CoA/ethylmalonyl-CoA epimerase